MVFALAHTTSVLLARTLGAYLSRGYCVLPLRSTDDLKGVAQASSSVVVVLAEQKMKLHQLALLDPVHLLHTGTTMLFQG